MRRAAWIVLTCVGAALMRSPGPGACATATDDPLTTAGPRVAETLPIPALPPSFPTPDRVSADGRFVLKQRPGPNSSEEDLDVLDLRGQRPPLSLPYCRDGSFVDGGRVLAYWSYGAGSSELNLLPLNGGKARRIFPGKEQEYRGDFRGWGTAWNAAAEEFFVVRQAGDGHETLHAIRRRDGRVRSLGIDASSVLISPDCSRIAITTIVSLPSKGWMTRARIANTAGEPHSDLGSAWPVAWTDRTHLLVIRQSGIADEAAHALFRADVTSGALRLLSANTGGVDSESALSPSHRWFATIRNGSPELVSTEDGRRSRVPLRDVTGVFWGRSDQELYYRRNVGWIRAEILPGQTALPADRPTPERIDLGSGESAGFPWQLLPGGPSPWRIYRNGSDVRCMARTRRWTWLGTSDGIRLLAPSGKELRLPGWADLLRGSSVERLVAAEEDAVLWLITRQVATINAPTEWNSNVVRVDLRTGALRQCALATKGGDGNSAQAEVALAGHDLVTLEPLHAAMRWSAQGTTNIGGATLAKLAERVVASGPHGTIWAGGTNGVIGWSPGAHHAQGWTEAQGLASAQVFALTELDGRLWIGTAAGLSRLDPGTGRVERLCGGRAVGQEPVLQLLPVGSILVARGEGWMAERSATTRAWTRRPFPAGGTLLTDGRRLYGKRATGSPLLVYAGNGHWRPFWSPPHVLVENAVTQILWERGRLWCGHLRQLSRLDPSMGNVRRTSLPANTHQVTGLARTPGCLWVALWRGGLLALDPANGHLRDRYFQPTGDRQPMGDDTELAVRNLVTYGSTLYLDADGPYRIRRGHRPEAIPGATGQLLGRVGNRLWFREDDEDERSSDSQLTTLRLPDLYHSKHSGVPMQTTDPVTAVPDGTLWAATAEIRHIRPDGRLLEHYPLPANHPGLSWDAVAWSPGSLWLAGNDRSPEGRDVAHLFQLDLRTGKWRDLPRCPLPGITQLLVAGDHLWVATWNGLARIASTSRPVNPGKAFSKRFRGSNRHRSPWPSLRQNREHMFPIHPKAAR